MSSVPIMSWQIEGAKIWISDRFSFLGLQNHCGLWLQLRNSKTFAPWKESCDQPRQCIKKQRHHFANKGPFSSSHVWMWELDYKKKLSAEELMLLNRGVGEDSWESLGLQRDPTHQSWVFIGRTDAEAEITILWPPDEKNWLIGKDPDAGEDWRQEEKGMTEDEMVGWHYRHDGREFE